MAAAVGRSCGSRSHPWTKSIDNKSNTAVSPVNSMLRTPSNRTFTSNPEQSFGSKAIASDKLCCRLALNSSDDPPSDREKLVSRRCSARICTARDCMEVKETNVGKQAWDYEA